MVEIVSKELSACASSVTIVHSEERTLGPGLMLSMLWLHDVQDNRHAVFIIVSNDTLMSLCSICTDNAIAFKAALCRLVIRNADTGAWFKSFSNYLYVEMVRMSKVLKKKIGI